MSNIYDDVPEEVFIEEGLNPNNEQEEVQQSQKKNAITMNVNELEDFLSEVNRMSGVITKLSEDVKLISNSADAMERLNNLSKLDFTSIVEEKLKDLKIEEFIYSATLSKMQPLVDGYEKNETQLKNVLFELERIKPQPVKKSWKKKIFYIFLILSLIGGVIFYKSSIFSFFTNSNQNSKIKTFKITIPRGALIYKNDSKKIKLKKNSTFTKVKKQGAFFVFTDKKNNIYKVKRSNSKIIN